MFSLFSITSCISKIERNVEQQLNSFLYMNWKPKIDYSNTILAIHGYNDYSNSFKIPGQYLSDNKIELISFDLRGFGRNSDKGNWYNLEFHHSDIIFNIKKIKKNNPKKKIYILGESMGGAIAISLANRYKELPIDGVILVAPAIWNFTKTNFLKSIPVKVLSKIFPNLKISGKGIIKVKASNNSKMLKELSEDNFFIHKPNLKSLQGMINLMDESYEDAVKYLNNPSYRTLILVPLKDEIVPRKPLIKILQNNGIKINESNLISIGAYKDSYHMILRDLDGNNITKDIKDWIFEIKNIEENVNFKDVLKIFENTHFYHRLD